MMWRGSHHAGKAARCEEEDGRGSGTGGEGRGEEREQDRRRIGEGERSRLSYGRADEGMKWAVTLSSSSAARGAGALTRRS